MQSDREYEKEKKGVERERERGRGRERGGKGLRRHGLWVVGLVVCVAFG